MAEKNPIKEIEKIEEKAEQKERYEAVYAPETIGVRFNKTGQVVPLKEKRTMEGEVGSAVLEARKLNELWEIKQATGI